MKTALIAFLCFLYMAAVLSACCTKENCDTYRYPTITLYFPEAYTPLHTFTGVRLNPATHQTVDSFSSTCGRSDCVFAPWVSYPHDEWGKYDYALSIDEYKGYLDTIYNISYDRQIEKIPCNNCFPSSKKGQADAVSYANLSFYHKGIPLHDGDTVLMRR